MEDGRELSADAVLVATGGQLSRDRLTGTAGGWQRRSAIERRGPPRAGAREGAVVRRAMGLSLKT
ncbi:MAG: hypothetical protein ACLVL7_08020 [Anaerotruncus massiliensis (ex Togo et al. 2019)]